MAFYGSEIRDQLKYNVSYSSLPAGLEIAVAPNYVTSPPEKKSLYTYKPLPPLPGSSLNQSTGQSESLDFIDIDATARAMTSSVTKRGSHQRRSIKKVENLLGHNLDYFSRQPTLEISSKTRNQGGALQVPWKAGLSKLDNYNRVDTFADIHQYMRSDSGLSLSSTSIYSEDNTVEDIVDIYSTGVSSTPMRDSPTSLDKHHLYSQPSIYSASAAELGHSSRNSYAQPLGRASLDGARTSPKSTTLAELISEERARFGAEGPRDRSQRRREDGTASFQNHFSSEAKTFEHPQWNEGDDYRRDFIPQSLTLRPKKAPELHRSMSRWSDHSSDRGIISTARDSVVSHIRSISSPFKVPSRPSRIFKEKAVTSTIQVPMAVDPVRKRAFSSSKQHPLMSPFPFTSPRHKKAHYDDPHTSGRPTIAHRISDSFKTLSGLRKPSVISSRVISNYARKGDGPDTPMPTKSSFAGLLSPTAILFQKGTLKLQDAIHKAKHAANIKSRYERRRDKLRKKIVIVGGTDPSLSVSRWV